MTRSLAGSALLWAAALVASLGSEAGPQPSPRTSRITMLTRAKGATVDFGTMATGVFALHDGSGPGRTMFFRYAPGKGRPLLLLHGNGVESRLYRSAIDDAIAAGRPVVIPDLPGHGETLALNLQDGHVAEQTKYYLDNYKYAVLDLMKGLREEFGLEEFQLAGHSLGAYIATEVASWPGSPVARLDLIDPPAGADRTVEHYAEQKFGRFSKTIAGALVQSMMNGWAGYKIAPDHLRKLIVRNSHAWGLPTDQRTLELKLGIATSLYDQWSSGLYDLIQPRLPLSLKPDLDVRVFSASHSIESPRPLAEQLAADWRHEKGLRTSLIPIDGADHLTILDHPGFLQELNGR